jgi:hypothetical protein
VFVVRPVHVDRQKNMMMMMERQAKRISKENIVFVDTSADGYKVPKTRPDQHMCALQGLLIGILASSKQNCIP